MQYKNHHEVPGRVTLRLSALLLACVAAVASTPAAAQSYPNKPIRMIVGFPAGGIMDIYGRSFANQLQQKLKSPVFVDNRPGAAGLIAADLLIKAPPDGYTITHVVPSTVSKAFMKDVPFDVLKVMQPIASAWVTPFVLTVNAQIPSGSLKEFVDYVKANPGKVNFGFTNGPNKLPMAVFAGIAGLKLQAIDYKGASQMNSALVANEIQAVFNGYQSVIGFASTGKLNNLAVSGNQRFPTLPNVPTTTELGYPGLDDLHSIGAMMGPVGVPPQITAVLNSAFHEIVVSPESERMLRTTGRALNVSNEELMKMVANEIAAWEAGAKVAGIQNP